MHSQELGLSCCGLVLVHLKDTNLVNLTLKCVSETSCLGSGSTPPLLSMPDLKSITFSIEYLPTKYGSDTSVYTSPHC